MLRRMAYGLCSYCGKDYTEHDPLPQASCGDGDLNCDHCHMSDFQAAEDDVTLIGREGLHLIYESLDRNKA